MSERFEKDGGGSRRKLTPLLICSLLSLAPGVASASYIALDLVYTPKPSAFQQTQDDPCILGNSDCKSPTGWEFVQTPNGGGTNEEVNLWSFGTDPGNQGASNKQSFTYTYKKGQTEYQLGPYYTSQQMLSVAPGGSFFIGIDTQGSSRAQYLQLFDVFECAENTANENVSVNTCSLLARYENNTPRVADASFGGIMDTNVGTGFTNYILRAANNGSNPVISPDKWYAFHAVYWQNGGVDAFFLLDEQSVTCAEGCESVPVPAPLSLIGIGALAAWGSARRRAGRSRA